ncbi:MAG TPA: undecaprenyldiphospho-muramoylpentapeptide beta-N-acetylglucosaminyltransferase [Polyangiaceae bacterium]|nr:undecaprenyldiphospho-muramoylpentapeptide beta-N-acetylglucosaminyltransferase [Polyangiaceae bacterium]
MSTVLFAGGGTGGHVFPMIAVADAVRGLRPDVDIVFVGTERGLETKLVPERGYRLELVHVEPMRGGGPAQFFRGTTHAALAVFKARGLVKRLAPQAVFSIGGYAAGPIAIAAWTLGIPVALMEPNSAVGLANQLVTPFVRRAYTAFPESDAHFPSNRVLRTGAPIREGFQPVEYRPGRPLRILVLGGSQGAKALNDAVPRALAVAETDVTVVHQCGAGKDAAVRALYDELGAADRARVVPFIEDMPEALAAADLIIGRAGAGAVAEICAVGRPSLLVPYPFAGDHQKDNALSLERAGAAVCILSKDATPERLAAEIERLAADPRALPRMADAARSLGRPDAARVIALDFLEMAGLASSGAAGARAAGGGTDTEPTRGLAAELEGGGRRV